MQYDVREWLDYHLDSMGHQYMMEVCKNRRVFQITIRVMKHLADEFEVRGMRCPKLQPWALLAALEIHLHPDRTRYAALPYGQAMRYYATIMMEELFPVLRSVDVSFEPVSDERMSALGRAIGDYMATAEIRCIETNGRLQEFLEIKILKPNRQFEAVFTKLEELKGPEATFDWLISHL